MFCISFHTYRSCLYRSYNLEFHGFAIEFDRSDFLCHAVSPPALYTSHSRWRRVSAYEVNTDSRYVALCVCVVREPQQQARFSDSRVTNEKEFEEVVVSAVVWSLTVPKFFPRGYVSSARICMLPEDQEIRKA